MELVSDQNELRPVAATGCEVRTNLGVLVRSCISFLSGIPRLQAGEDVNQETGASEGDVHAVCSRTADLPNMSTPDKAAAERATQA